MDGEPSASRPAEMAPSRPSASHASRTAILEARLKDMATAFVHAVNTRAWQRDRWPWNHLAPHFVAERIFSHWPPALDMDGFLQHAHRLTVECPDYTARPLEISATASEATSRATVFINLANDGFTPGVTRYSVGILDFEGVGGGRWHCVRYRSMPGSPAATGRVPSAIDPRCMSFSTAAQEDVL